MEVGTNNFLPFLDVMVTRLHEGRLCHSVYRKPTHTDRYLHTTSHHHPAQKRSVIDSLIDRAITICQPDKLQNELEHLQTFFRQNGYDHHTIKSAIQCRVNPKSDNTSNRPTDLVSTANLPFISQVTDRLAKILKRQKVKTVFKPATKIAQVFPSAKDSRQALDCREIYSIPCSCGVKYIGETGVLTHSAVAVEIHKCPHNLNRDNGYYLRNIWKTALDANARSFPPTPPGTGQFFLSKEFRLWYG
ncbi:uncharacterized protein LOC135127308 [Zophobas morio]|uniref:uncharacterized protein LOC135127308 n=1 Tax=Zophobas morio TaxID=2755281 RepID=UPI0030827606